MKFTCRCGAVVYDISDYQDNKAYFIPDVLYEGALEAIRPGSSAWEQIAKVKRAMYQCSECARLYLTNHDGALSCFSPSEGEAFGILNGGRGNA